MVCFTVYFQQINQINCVDDEQKLIKCYEELLDRHPRSTTIVHMLLSALQGVGFERQLSLYLQNMLRKGVPSIFVLIKELYKNPEKARIIESVVTGFEKSLHAMGKFVESATGMRAYYFCCADLNACRFGTSVISFVGDVLLGAALRFSWRLG